MDTMDQMEYMVRRMVGKTLTYKRLPTGAFFDSRKDEVA